MRTRNLVQVQEKEEEEESDQDEHYRLATPSGHITFSAEQN